MMQDDFGSFEESQNSESGDVEETESNSSPPSSNTDDAKAATNVANSLEEYGVKIIKELNANKIAPTPYNYRIYFEKLLENQPQQFKDDVFQHVDDQRPAEQQALLESKVVKAQNHMAYTLQQVEALIKNLRLLQNILRKHKHEVEAVNNAIALQNIIAVFEKELNKLDAVVERQLAIIKNVHEKTLTVVEDINESVISNSVYGIYNKRFLEKRVEAEAESSALSGSKSTLILICISKKLQARINSDRTTLIINRSLSKILQRVVNRSDIVAYYDGGIFGVLLCYHDKEDAKRFANRLIECVARTNIIIDEKEIPLSVCTGIAEINNMVKSKEIIKNALEALKKASNSNVSFIVYGEK